jgi:hypothetical protein
MKHSCWHNKLPIALHRMNNLKALEIGDNPLKNDELKLLRKKLPKCNIYDGSIMNWTYN